MMQLNKENEYLVQHSTQIEHSTTVLSKKHLIRVSDPESECEILRILTASINFFNNGLKKRELTLMLERSTGDSRKEEGLRPGGIVIHAEREIGSLAGDMSLYLAPLLLFDPTAEASQLEILSCCSEDSLMEGSGDEWLYCWKQ